MVTRGVLHKSPDDEWEKTCGIHIHMSKSAFTTYHLYKFLFFFYAKANRKFLVALSERGKESKYASWSTDNSNHIKLLAKSKTNADSDPHSHYHAINMHKSGKTIEVRIFNSTMQPESFHKNVEFCKSLFEFTKDAPKLQMTVPNYLMYVHQNGRTYRNLYSFCRDQLRTYLPCEFNLKLK
jgi:hypothetical protein